MAERFLIAPFTSGLEKDLPVWRTTEDSFYKLKNAYVHRGVIKKRFGSSYIGTGVTTELLKQLKTRLRINLGATDGNGFISSDLNPIPAGAVLKAGQMLSIGSELFTVPDVGTPVEMLRTVEDDSCYFNTSTGSYNIVLAEANKPCFFYPSEPVMGLTMHESGAISDHSAIAFDTRFAYLYTGGGWARVGTQVYTGDSSNYFWSTNYSGVTPEDCALFSTNFKADGLTSDPMYYTLDKLTWTEFQPIILTGGVGIQQTVITAKVMIHFSGHFLLFHTYEYDDRSGAYEYKKCVNRMRYTGAHVDPLNANAWLEAKQAGYCGGGYRDAPTEEEIVSVQPLRDRLIVYFERSTYEVVYTHDHSQPFVFRRLSAELGSESSFASIPLEEGVFTVGSSGIHMCNGLNVVRADSKIPLELSRYLKVSDAIKRIHGIKDARDELLYWAIPSQRSDDIYRFPDKIIMYNYRNHTWAVFDDAITCFGYFEQSLGDTWEEDYQTWEDDTSTWEDPESMAGHRKVIAGNQQGFVFALRDSDHSNAPVLQVSNIDGEDVTVEDHNLRTDDYVRLHNSGVIAQDIIYRVADVTEDKIELLGLNVPAYKGGGTLSRVSRISIKSTAWNPYIKQGKNVSLSKIIFGVKKTGSGEITVNFIPSQADISMESDASLGTGILETKPYALVPLESEQALLWHSVYFLAEGNSIQIHMTWSDTQMLNKSIVMSEFEIQGIILETSATGDIG